MVCAVYTVTVNKVAAGFWHLLSPSCLFFCLDLFVLIYSSNAELGINKWASFDLGILFESAATPAPDDLQRWLPVQIPHGRNIILFHSPFVDNGFFAIWEGGTGHPIKKNANCSTSKHMTFDHIFSAHISNLFVYSEQRCGSCLGLDR